MGTEIIFHSWKFACHLDDYLIPGSTPKRISRSPLDRSSREPYLFALGRIKLIGDSLVPQVRTAFASLLPPGLSGAQLDTFCRNYVTELSIHLEQPSDVTIPDSLINRIDGFLAGVASLYKTAYQKQTWGNRALFPTCFGSMLSSPREGDLRATRHLIFDNSMLHLAPIGPEELSVYSGRCMKQLSESAEIFLGKSGFYGVNHGTTHSKG